MRTRFVVIGAPRTGTSLMIETLDAHPEVRCYGGVFNRGSKGALDPDAPDVEQWLERLYESEARLDSPRVRRPEAKGGPRAVGFKVHEAQWAGTRARANLRDRPDVRIVHVVRENVLRTLISAKRAAATRRFQSREAPAGPPAPVGIELDELRFAAEADRAERARIARDFADHPRLEVEYASWRIERAAMLRRVQEFLQVEVRDDLCTDLVKTGAADLRAALENYEALYTAAQSTELRRFFEDAPL